MDDLARLQSDLDGLIASARWRLAFVSQLREFLALCARHDAEAAEAAGQMLASLPATGNPEPDATGWADTGRRW